MISTLYVATWYPPNLTTGRREPPFLVKTVLAPAQDSLAHAGPQVKSAICWSCLRQDSRCHDLSAIAMNGVLTRL